jgi:hypothetical protein
MDEQEVVWPMGLSDQDPALADRPLVFNPKGFLVAILEDDNHAEQGPGGAAGGWVRRP